MNGKNTLSATISEEQRNVAYGLAEQYRKAKTDADQKAAASKKKTASKKAGKVHFNGDRSSLTERQSASLKAIGKIADVLGVQVYVFESKLGKNGRRIGANGWYDPQDGSIHIDLHAGANGEGTMIFTMAHELTHFIRQWSPAKFKILADFLMQEYGKKGVSVDALVREQQAKAKRTGRTISYDTAYEEVVADSMEAMLSDGKVMEKLAKLKARDAALWQKIKDYISKLAEKIRMVYKGLAPDSVEGRYVVEMKDAVEKFQELFTEGLADASENIQAVEQIDDKNDTDTRYYIREAFYKEFDAWDKKDTHVSFVTGTTSDALKSVGMKDQNIILRSGTVLQKIKDHPEMTFDLFKGIPELLEHPVIVQFSDAIDPKTKRPKYNSSITVLGDLYADVKEGTETVKKPVLVSLELLPAKKKGTAVLDFAIIKSAYSKNALQQYLNDNSILYIDPDIKRTDSWLSRTRLQLPFGENRYGPVRKITYADGKVKVQNPKNMTEMQKRLFEAGIIDEFGNKLLSTRDSDGNQLSQEQQEFFQDSKVRDADGNLMVMYHGTPNGGFTKFRSGTYFTPNPGYADIYQNAGASSISTKRNAVAPMTYKVYLDIKKPFDTRKANEQKIFMEEFYRKYGNGTPLAESGLPDWVDGMDLQEFIEEMGYDYDGLILDEGGVGGYGEEVVSRGLSYVVFDPAQVKDVDNKTPTSDPDYRYSYRGTNQDGIEVYETSRAVMDLRWKDRKVKYLDVMKNVYRGRTARFERNGHIYYARFDQSSIRKHIYGDNRSSTDGVKALIKAGADGDVFDLVERSRYTGSQKNKKNNTDADYFDYFVKTVQIDGKVFDLVADVEKKYGVNGGYVYTLALIDNKTIKASPALGTPNTAPVNNAGNASGNNVTQPTLKVKQHSNRDIESVSNRSLLANAFEGAARTDMEKQKIQEYRDKIDLMNGQEQKLRKLNQQIKELSFANGKRDTAKIRALRDEATKTANRISIYDKQLLRLESSKPLQDVLEREKKKAYQRAEKKGKEALAEYRQKAEAKQQEIIERYQESRKKGAEGRKKTALRHKIRTFKDKLVKSLEHPTDRVYVPSGLINAMVDVCNLIDTDTDLYKKDGSINKAQEQRNLTKEKLQNLKDEYERLKDNTDPLYKGEFDEMVYSYLTELRENAKGKSINEMSLDELSEMYEILRGIEETLQNARKLIGWGEAEDVYETADAIISEQRAISERRKDGKRSAAQKAKDATLDLSLSPVRNVERMSGYNQDSSLLKLFKKFEHGVRKKNKFTMDAYKSFGNLTAGKEYDDAVYTEFGKKYVDIKGRKFSLSKMQMMQAILSMERELANGMSHIKNKGFSFADLDMLRKGKIREAISREYSHQVPAAVDMVAEFSTALKDDQWCQDYMKAARNFFNATAKDAINETMMVLKHRIVAKDKSYIPFEVDKNFVTREISAEDSIQQTISSYGMLKETEKGAPQPLIVTGLNNVIDRHIDMVGNVYGLAVEVRNFNKVWNAGGGREANSDAPVKAIIQENWGDGGVKHIEQAVQDIQGPRHNEQSWLYRKVKSGYIGATFLLNLSVVTKQIGSLFSANSMLNWRDPGRQIGNLLWTMANSKKISAEVDKYTASAWMRRQGLSDAELHTFMTEGRKSKLGRLTSKMPSVINPAKWITAMDHAVALSLWRYAKIDTKKRTGLEGEALLKATAEFYDEVIENTQSMTDVLHRPEIQKKSGVIAESFAMFKTDLYQMAGQLNVAAGRFAANKSKENAKILGRTVYSIAMSAIWGQLMTTVFALLRYKVNQYRDDEDKDLTVESWLKRQGYSFAGDIMGYIFPIFGSEMVGMFEDIMYGEPKNILDNITFTAVNDLYDSIITIGSALKDGEALSPSDIKKLSIKALQVFGIPANNIIRTYEAVTLHAKDIANGEFFSFEAGVDRSAGNHIHRIVEAVDAGKIDVAMGLYEEAVEETAKGMSDEELKDASSSLKTALGNYYKDGKTTRETTEKILANIFGMDENEIYWTLDKWDHAKENLSSDGYSKYDDFFTAVETGKDLKKVIKQYIDNGVSKETLASQITSHYKPIYGKMTISERANIKGYLLNAFEQCGVDREDAAKKLQYWEFLGENPDSDLNQYQIADYYEFAKPAGISADVYTDYCNKVKGITGEGKKKRRMDVIHSLPLTIAQKDALYYAEGWAASTIHEAPWH